MSDVVVTVPREFRGVSLEVFTKAIEIWNRLYPGRVCGQGMDEVFVHLAAAEAAYIALPALTPEPGKAVAARESTGGVRERL